MPDTHPSASESEASPLIINAVSRDHWGSLMAAALDGNGGAYDRLLREIGPWLSNYYARRLPASMVDDATQDTLLAVHQKRHTYQVDRPFRPWLRGIARYKWIDRLRAMGRDPTDSLDEQEDFEPSVEGHESAVTSSIVIEGLLDRLKPAQTTAIRLVKIYGHSIEEAAALSGQSESLVKVNIHRGLLKLKSILQPAYR
jgi:RNA polymerase sigma factor (sigma-70 family)